MKLLMAANWKMYKNQESARATLVELATRIAPLPQGREVAVFAPFPLLPACAAAVQGAPIRLGGQNCYPETEGAFTGEVSPTMLQDAGCTLVLTGHSERRAILGESDEFVGQKTAFALQMGLDVVLCIGETLAQREAGALEEVLARQLAAGLADVPASVPPQRISIAYEPVWAIGTGKVAGPVEIAAAHTAVRRMLHNNFKENASQVRILYGGSVKPDNAKEIIALDNVNGVLVGGASLQAESFSRIALA